MAPIPGKCHRENPGYLSSWTFSDRNDSDLFQGLFTLRQEGAFLVQRLLAMYEVSQVNTSVSDSSGRGDVAVQNGIGFEQEEPPFPVGFAGVPVHADGVEGADLLLGEFACGIVLPHRIDPPSKGMVFTVALGIEVHEFLVECFCLGVVFFPVLVLLWHGWNLLSERQPYAGLFCLGAGGKFLVQI